MRLVQRHREGRLERKLDSLEGGVARMSFGPVGMAHWADHELLAFSGPGEQLDDDRLLVELSDDARVPFTSPSLIERFCVHMTIDPSFNSSLCGGRLPAVFAWITSMFMSTAACVLVR